MDISVALCNVHATYHSAVYARGSVTITSHGHAARTGFLSAKSKPVVAYIGAGHQMEIQILWISPSFQFTIFYEFKKMFKNVYTLKNKIGLLAALLSAD